MPPMQHIMLVEDDMSLAEWFSDYLTEHGYLVTLVNRGDLAIELIASDKPDLVVLDIMLPVKDGFDVCREVRDFYSGPILMMTARDHEMDEILGLELGADDYVTKPVKPRVLLSRIKALFRRANIQSAPLVDDSNTLCFGEFAIDYHSRTTTLSDEVIAVSSNEFDVLWLLALKANTLVTRQELVTELRGIEYDGFDRSVDIIISRLRKKLGDNATTPYRIKTVWGKGYLLAKDAWTK
ncbi:response regulator [Pseudoalteromonas sp. C2R02]|uniref:response regulator n=1 Tax=Pseudoalteromonas sp. C2R02 TaxID=2841565 RepID=UPI001C09A405|nr:response regulator [Pseudoalteromonas sp. C2R02]MBU2972367.1 response regulator [Pseudoalteromonas sp. C2R02]